jgi:hypothetical protein
MSDDVLELLKTVPQPPMSVDPYAAMAAGRRAKVRRRRLVVVAAAAAALAIATGSALVAGWDSAVPARPSPTTPTPSTTPTTARSLIAQLDAGQGQLTARLDAATSTITVQGPGDSGSPLSLAVPVPASPGPASCRVSRPLLVQACAVRGAVREGIIAYSDPATPDVTPSPPVVGRFSVPDVSVVIVSASAADLPSLRGAAWELDDGTVADSSGSLVPQAHGRSVPVTVFASALKGSFFLGLRVDTANGWVGSGPAVDAGVPRTGMGDATGDYYAYVLPAGAVSGEVRPPASATVRGQEVLTLGSRKVLVAQLTGVERFSGPTAEWVDAAGSLHQVPGP